MPGRTYTEQEVAALLSKATGGTDFDVIAARPYHKIEAPDGTVLCWPYTTTGDSGPITIGGQHPDDWFGVEEQDNGNGGKKYVATARYEGAPTKADKAKGPSGATPDDFPGKAALDAAGLTTYAKVRNYGDLTDVAGIGAATAAKIQDRLAADAAGGN